MTTRLRGEPVRSYIEALRKQVDASHSFSPAKCQLLYEAFIRNDVWMVPTLTALRSDGWSNDPQFTDDDRLRYFDARTRALLAPSADESPESRWTEADYVTARELLAFNQKLVGEMSDAGVPILAGTDAMNPYVFPGFSLHDELELLVEAGLTEAEALQAATLNPARFFGATDSLGTVERGKLADLVLLDANPLEDISHIQEIAAVLLDGRYLDREALDSLLTEAERSTHSDTVLPAVPPLLVELGEAWVEAVNEGDLDRFVDLYADDVIRIPPNAEPVMGREAVRAMEQSWLTENELHAEAPTEGGFVAGDRAVGWGSFRIRQTVRATGETFRYGGHWMSVYRQGDDGTWRIWREIWNDSPSASETTVRPEPDGSLPDSGDVAFGSKAGRDG